MFSPGPTAPLPTRWLLLLALVALTSRPHPDWDETKSWVRESFPGVPLVTVDELRADLAGPDRPRPVLLDARSREEFHVSHLEGARRAPSLGPALRALEGVDRGAPVVVYCSVGYRSGQLASELRRRGFEDVSNLEGSLFEWANRGYPLVDDEGERVARVHPFDEEWGRLLTRWLWPPGF